MTVFKHYGKVCFPLKLTMFSSNSEHECTCKVLFYHSLTGKNNLGRIISLRNVFELCDLFDSCYKYNIIYIFS